MDECVKVVVRCRPMNRKERDEDRKSIVEMDCSLGQVKLSNPRRCGAEKLFTFDQVYDETSTQKTVYNEVAFPLVESIFEGFNGTIFAYGQTGCGKTWTMSGREDTAAEAAEVGEEEGERHRHRGIIPNSFEHIFETIKLKLLENESNAAERTEFLVRASYLEIYNEEMRDLMQPQGGKKLLLKEDPEKGIHVQNLTYTVVEDRAQIDEVLAKGTRNRTVGATKMNETSSRSHSIFSIVIEMSEAEEGSEGRFRVGKLNLIDLAGSERQSKTGATGNRLKEGCKINLSLSALGNVISALVDSKGQGRAHVPYRDSKLTRLLQDSLGGNARTVMISAISPADYNYEETLSTLRYANRAKNIKNKPVINEDPKDALLREYKLQIQQLTELLKQQQGQGVALSQPLPKPSSGPETTVGTPNEAQEHQVDGKDAADQALMIEYKDAIMEQRNMLGAALDAKEEEIQEQRRQREELERKLQELQARVLHQGYSSKNADARTVEDNHARKLKKDREHRRAHLRLKQKKRREAEMLQAQTRAEEEKKVMEEEFRSVQGMVEAKEHALRAMKKTLVRKMDLARQEMEDLEQEFQSERQNLMAVIRDQSREIKLLDQVVSLFLSRQERSRLWEHAEWNHDHGEWRLPPIKARKDLAHVALPELDHNPTILDRKRKKKRSKEHLLMPLQDDIGPRAASVHSRASTTSSASSSISKHSDTLLATLQWNDPLLLTKTSSSSDILLQPPNRAGPRLEPIVLKHK